MQSDRRENKAYGRTATHVGQVPALRVGHVCKGNTPSSCSAIFNRQKVCFVLPSQSLTYQHWAQAAPAQGLHMHTSLSDSQLQNGLPLCPTIIWGRSTGGPRSSWLALFLRSFPSAVIWISSPTATNGSRLPDLQG